MSESVALPSYPEPKEPKSKHAVLDIETLDLKPTAIILSIGVTIVDEKGMSTGDTWYRVLDRNTQFERTSSTETVNFWFDNKDSFPYHDKPTQLIDALQQLMDFLAAHDLETIWTNGTDFDIPILTNAYDYFEIPVPWKYNSVRDVRTMRKMFRLAEEPKNPTRHHALQDAVWESMILRDICARFKLELK